MTLLENYNSCVIHFKNGTNIETIPNKDEELGELLFRLCGGNTNSHEKKIFFEAAAVNTIEGTFFMYLTSEISGIEFVYNPDIEDYRNEEEDD